MSALNLLAPASAAAYRPNRADMRRHLEWLAEPVRGKSPDLRLEIAWADPETGPNRAKTCRLDEIDDAVGFAAWINGKGCNVYVGATLKRADTPIKGRTNSPHAALATCLPVDIDGDFDIGAHKLATFAKPQLLVLTGRTPQPRGQLWIRIAPTEEMEAWSEVNQRSVNFSGGDRNALGTYRLMRLAGSISYPPIKKQARGYVAELTTLHPVNAPAYDVHELLDRFPSVSLGPALVQPPAGDGRGDGNLCERPPVNRTNVALIQSMLDALPAEYASEYDLWLRAGFALHSFDDGDVGLALWERFSNRSPEKAEGTDFAGLWAGFSRKYKGSRISLGWLWANAQERGWRALPLGSFDGNRGLTEGNMTETKQDILDSIADGSIGDQLFTPLSAAEVDALVEKAKADPGAPFEGPMIARIAALKRADLPTFMRARERLKTAKIKVSELDKALAASDGTYDGPDDGPDEGGGQGRAIRFQEIEPWAAPVEGAALLDELVAQILRHVRLPREAAVAVALWIVHAHCFHVFAISPQLAITSPEKRCGKTTLLRVVQALVAKPLAAANITPAAMFRTIEKYRPTLLIDEADTFLPDNEELRGIINSGHERDGQAIRLVGEDHEPRAFSTFCPTVIAAIGSLPGTIDDRSVTVAMRRRLASETIVRFRSDRAGHLHELARKAARWVADHERELCVADPDMPEALHDRARDNWRGPMAIADLAGGDWPHAARAASEALSANSAEQDEQSRGVMLLGDILRVFDGRLRKGGKAADRVSSTDLVADLVALVDRPWLTWSRGKPITAAAVARQLKTFGIVPNTIKLSDGKQPNGYKRSQFADAFARYLPQPPGTPVQGSPSSPTSTNPGVSEQCQTSPRRESGEVSNRRNP